MNVRIRFSEISPSVVQSEFIRRRLEHALSANETDIQQIDVSIIGIERVDGDRIKYCKVDVKLSNGSMVSSDSAEADLEIAIHRATDRAGWEAARSLGRHHRQNVYPPYPTAQRRSVGRELEYPEEAA
jgi:hypothetical protein